MGTFIITSENKPSFNYKGEQVEETGKRALFYCKSIGKHRVYRDSIEPNSKKLILFKFKKRELAEVLCSEINEAYKDDFKVEEI